MIFAKNEVMINENMLLTRQTGFNRFNSTVKVGLSIWSIQMFSNAPGNILPTRGKTIPDRREFDKLMESGSRVIDNSYLTALRGI